MAKEIIIYADESERRGKHYSNFYGGVLVFSNYLAELNDRLNTVKREQHLHGEIKWGKVTENYLGKYKAVIDEFFSLMIEDRLKTRIMFTDNRFVPQDLTAEHEDQKYFLLYYQFIKHAFGIQHAGTRGFPLQCRLYLDRLPDTKEKNEQFKGFLKGLEKTKEMKGRLIIDRNQIAEVDSHQHVILQCLDVVLGAIHFRLNKKHLKKVAGKRVRGKRTIAKEKLYKHILMRIQKIYPHFNIGMTTGIKERADRWNHPYRHWVFRPKSSILRKRGDKA